MSITINRYVDIISGVVGQNAVVNRELIGRIATSNLLVPADSVVEFSSYESVAAYFGSGSTEAKVAAVYFGFISKNIVSPEKLGFIRWSSSAVAARIFGSTSTKTLADYTAITAGDLTVKINGSSHNFSGIDLSAAITLAGVAAIIQTAIQGYVAGGAGFTAATVTYNSSRDSFDLVSGTTGPGEIVIDPDAANDVGAALGWLGGTGFINSVGQNGQTPVELMVDTDNASSNFGSFAFLDELTNNQFKDLAEWNHGKNVKYMFCSDVTAANAAARQDLVAGYSGTALTVQDAGEKTYLFPMIILAATDYKQRASVQNYMFQVYDAAFTPFVTTDTDADVYDAINVNYYGRTQQAGRQVSFYQRGKLQGSGTAPIAMNVFANEIWLKDDCTTAMMNLLLALPKISANAAGRAQGFATITDSAERAIFNGTISVGKTLNNTQKQYISSQTGDPNAWREVQTNGYWLNVFFQEDAPGEYVMKYVLIYSKDDVINKVEGSHQLI